MKTRVWLTPWSRDGLEAAGVNRFELLGRVPEGWAVNGHAKSAHGPFVFVARRGEVERAVSAIGYKAIPEALERLFVFIAEESLEDQLAASLAALA